jgi:DNA-binding beta-propeller fold protein YncE
VLAVDERLGRVLVFGAEPGQAIVTVLDASSGKVLATVTLPQALALSRMVVDEKNGRVFAVGGADTDLAVFDAATGKLLSTVAFKHGTDSLVVDERTRRVFVGYYDAVAVLNADTAKVIATISTNGEHLALDEQGGHVFAEGTAEGNVSGVAMLDATSGRILHVAHPQGYSLYGRTGESIPDALAVDASTHRVFLPEALNQPTMGVLDSRTDAVLHNSIPVLFSTYLLAPLVQWPSRRVEPSWQ